MRSASSDGFAALHHDAGEHAGAAASASWITNGATISITNDTFTEFSRGSAFGIPNLFLMVLLVAIPPISSCITANGAAIFAIGSNAEAARLSGVNTKAMIYVAYVISAFCAAFAGVRSARAWHRQSTQGEGWGAAIASSVIGGTSLFGAVGSVYGPLLGSVHPDHDQQWRQPA